MILGRREEIAVAVLVACARSAPGRLRTEDAAIAAEATRVQTAQIVHALMRARLIETVRGKGGGIRLVGAPEAITIGSVIRLVGSKRNTPQTSIRHNDPLDAIAAAADAQAIDAFESFTIADLAFGQIDDKLACFSCSIRLRVLRAPATRPQAEHPVAERPEESWPSYG